MKELKSEIQLVAQKKPKCLKPCYNDLNDKKGNFIFLGHLCSCMYVFSREREKKPSQIMGLKLGFKEHFFLTRI